MIKYYLCSHAVLAVKAFHETGQRHLDLKADNMVLFHRRTGALLSLIDFGYCSDASPQDDRRGTAVYAPPERFTAWGTFDPTRFDIFMLGSLLITIIFRDTPFSYKGIRCQCN